MIISHKYKFIFIKTNKTAGTSLEVFLSGVCGEKDIFTPVWPPANGHLPRNYKGLWNPIPDLFWKRKSDFRYLFKNIIHFNKFHSHIPALDVSKRIDKKIWNSYFKFCVERNPWDKTLSHYHMLAGRSSEPLTLDQYLANNRLCINYSNYCDSNNKIMVDQVIKYESLNEELAALFSKFSIPFSGHLGVFEKSEYRKDRRHYREVFSSSQRKAVADAFQIEIDLHGYYF
jgi:hypothetical protein